MPDRHGKPQRSGLTISISGQLGTRRGPFPRSPPPGPSARRLPARARGAGGPGGTSPGLARWLPPGWPVSSNHQNRVFVKTDSNAVGEEAREARRLGPAREVVGRHPPRAPPAARRVPRCGRPGGDPRPQVRRPGPGRPGPSARRPHPRRTAALRGLPRSRSPAGRGPSTRARARAHAPARQAPSAPPGAPSVSRASALPGSVQAALRALCEGGRKDGPAGATGTPRPRGASPGRACGACPRRAGACPGRGAEAAPPGRAPLRREAGPRLHPHRAGVRAAARGATVSAERGRVPSRGGRLPIPSRRAAPDRPASPGLPSRRAVNRLPRPT